MARERSWSAAMGQRDEGDGVEWKPTHWKMNCCLSNQKSHMMGKQRSGTALWQRLVSDFSLRTTTAFGSFWEARQPGEWIKRNIVWRVLEGGWVGGGGGGMRSYSGGENRRGKRGEGREMQPWITGSLLVQGKFIGTLARIHVICLAVHWSRGSISLPLQSVQLDKRAGGLSNLQQPGTGSLPTYISQMKFTISIMDPSPAWTKRPSHWQV